MDRFSVVANVLRVRIAGVADWLYGCSHRITSFPMTLRTSMRVDGEQSTQSDTYIVCLQCGRHFAYDWITMHIAKRRVAWVAPPAPLPALGEARAGSR